MRAYYGAVTSRIRRFLPLLTVLVLLPSACSGGGGGSKVKVGTVGRSDVAEVVSAPGTVTARATATLRSPADGSIRRLYVTDGQPVHAGQLLALLSSPSAQDQLRQAKDADRSLAGGGSAPSGIDVSGLQRQSDRTARKGFAAARAVAGKIQDPRQRALVLAEITKAEADYAAAAAAARGAVARLNAGLGSVTAALASISQAQRVQTRAAVRAAQRVVDGLELRAPFDGTAGLGGPASTPSNLAGLASQLPTASLPGAGAARDAASVAEGAPVSTGDAVVTVTDAAKLSVAADVDENNILQIKQGAQASVQLDAVPDATYPAQVTGIGVTPRQSATGGGVTYQVTLSLGPGSGGAPWPKPGMSATVGLTVREARNAVAVPSAAIVTSGRDSTVWVESPGGSAVRRVVEVGAQGDTSVEIRSGLREGDRIVVGGADTVKPGQKLPR